MTTSTPGERIRAAREIKRLTEARWAIEELATIDATILALLEELDALRARGAA